MKKYWHFFKIGFQVSIAYPVSIIFRVLRHATLVTLFVVLWAALLQNKSEIGGFNLSSIVTYYMLVEIIDIIYTQTPARILSRDVQTGDLNNFLTKPINYWKYLLSYTVGQQLANSSLSILAVIGAFILFPNFVSFPKEPLYLFGFFVFSVCAFLISHQILFTVGTLIFHVSEIAHIRQGVNQLMGLLGGRWVPLSFFPPAIAGLLGLMPFSFLFSFPIRVFQQQVSFSQMSTALVVEIAWLGLLLFIGKNTWEMGVKKYEAYGH